MSAAARRVGPGHPSRLSVVRAARGRARKGLRISLALALALLARPIGPVPAHAQEAAVPSARPAAEAATFEEAVERVRARPEFAHSTFGIALRDLETDRILYALHPDELFTPASTTKLLTEGTALALLGADYRFRTRVYRTGPVDAEGVLEGDLVLVASGDPNLSNRIRPDGTLAYTDHDHAYGGSPDTEAVPGDPLAVIDALAAGVHEAGIRRIRGDVLVDASLFPEGEPEQGSGVVISPLSVNDNVVDLTVGPGEAPGRAAVLRASPETGYARFENRVTTGPPGSDPEVRWTDLRREDGSRVVEVTGSFPAGEEPILYAWAVPVPSRFGEFVLAERLQARGIVASPPPTDRKPDFEAMAESYTEDRVVAEHVSPPLSEEVEVTLKVSQNLHASMVPYLLGALLGPDSVPALAAGFDRERRFLEEEAGLDLSGASQGDGAGGDRVDFFTPAFMIGFLDHMATREDFPLYHEALPVLGRDGTLRDIQPDSEAAGHVHAKTGTYILWNALTRSWMLTSKALAGYVTRPDGRRLAFAFFLNRMPTDLSPSEAAELAGQALGELAAAARSLPVGGPAAVPGGG